MCLDLGVRLRLGDALVLDLRVNKYVYICKMYYTAYSCIHSFMFMCFYRSLSHIYIYIYTHTHIDIVLDLRVVLEDGVQLLLHGGAVARELRHRLVEGLGFLRLVLDVLVCLMVWFVDRLCYHCLLLFDMLYVICCFVSDCFA